MPRPSAQVLDDLRTRAHTKISHYQLILQLFEYCLAEFNPVAGKKASQAASDTVTGLLQAGKKTPTTLILVAAVCHRSMYGPLYASGR